MVKRKSAATSKSKIEKRSGSTAITEKESGDESAHVSGDDEYAKKRARNNAGTESLN